MTSLSPSIASGEPAVLDLVLRLQSRREEAQDILSFELIDPAGALLPPFEAGSHLLVECAPGVVRSYSMCNSPAERHRYLIAVLREPQSRGGSAAAHGQWRVGQTVRVSRPRNHFQLAADRGRVVLLAGGIGITPLLAMAEQLTLQGRPFELHYCTRSAARTAFAERIRGSAFAASVTFHHDDGPAGQAFDAGRAIGDAAAGDHLYACGPGGFLSHVMGTAQGLGWPAAQLHQEVFQAEVPLAVAGDTSFEIVVSNRGVSVQVPAGQTALEALLAAGIDVMSSCEQGICGACLMGVVDGQPDHRDYYLTEADRVRNDCFTPCCSRSLTARLVVEA